MRLKELLGFKDIVIQCHNFPDADAVASGYGVYRYFCLNGITPRLIYSGPKKITKSNMLIMIKELGIPIEYVTELSYEPELLITVDCVYGESNVQKFDAKNLAVIDHHICTVTPPQLSEIRSNYGSCSSIVAKMLGEEGIRINSEINLSTALYYGLFMDTNGFSELGHPADKDLRDFADYDFQLMNTLRNSNLSSDEMIIAGEALNSCTYDNKHGIALVETKPCDPNILGFISDLLLQVDIVDNCVVYCHNNAGYKLSVRSCTNKINASEYAKFLTYKVGNGGGHAGKAGGFISGSLLPEVDISEFFNSRIASYHENTDIMYAGKDTADVTGMGSYVKRSVIVGYVPSVDIVPAGTEIMIRMLEADVTVKADEDTYIMIGISGEVYPIKKSVFEESYRLSDELPEMDYEYAPTVLDRENNCNKPLVPYIKGCVTSGGAVIMARELTRNTKIFTEWDKNSYLWGAPGDYLAVRSGDYTDMYIIKRDIFLKTYERKD